MSPPDIRVLVLDNEPRLCRMLSMELKDAGFTSVATYNLDEATREVEKEIPDLFLFDIALSDRLTGFEFAEVLMSEYPVLAPLNFFFLSAWLDKFHAPSQFLAEHIFHKPLHDEAFTKLANRMLKAVNTRRGISDE